MNRGGVRGALAAALLFLSLGGYCGPPRWVDRTGQVVPDGVLKETRGDEHCGWQSSSFLRFKHEWYVRDPEGVVPQSELAGSYEADAPLPPDAVATGFRGDGRQLWVSSSTGREAIFVVTEEATERWPRLTGGCL